MYTLHFILHVILLSFTFRVSAACSVLSYDLVVDVVALKKKTNIFSACCVSMINVTLAMKQKTKEEKKVANELTILHLLNENWRQKPLSMAFN